MRKIQFIKTLTITVILVVALVSSIVNGQTSTLKQAFAGKFYIGTALNERQINETDTAAVRVINRNSAQLFPKTA
jgi:endo-1,4-beta-xylanase